MVQHRSQIREKDSAAPPATPQQKNEELKTTSLDEASSPGFLGAAFKKNDSFVWAGGLPILRVVITGVSAGTPKII
jgi:hypothetical protein